MFIRVQTCSFGDDYALTCVHVKGFCVQTCALGDRLREERERLELNQEQLGQIGGVNRNTQGKYEKGERSPDAAYLAAVAASGVDVLYVVTGMRTPKTTASISEPESRLLEQYRSMSDENKATVERVAVSLANYKH